MTTLRQNPREGIALIVVLGFLALLTLMAISFSIEMRTERLASSVYMDAGKARQLIDVALTRAMADVDNDLIEAKLNAPDWVYFESTGGSIDKQLYDGEAANYVPKFDAGAPAQASFIDITDPLNPDGSPIARYAYLVVNQTGLLDVNEVGQTTNRSEGATPGEIQITEEFNPEIFDHWDKFSTDLPNVWRRIETMNEFIAITGASNFNSSVSSIGLYSRSLPELDPEGNPKFFLSDHSMLISNKAEVTERLRKSDFEDFEQQEQIFANLVDFLDTDYVPGGSGNDLPKLDVFCAEPVPMINELVISNDVSDVAINPVDGTVSLVYRVFVEFEVWDPFLAGTDYTLVDDELTINLVPVADHTASCDLSGISPVISQYGSEEFRVYRYVYERSFTGLTLDRDGRRGATRISTDVSLSGPLYLSLGQLGSGTGPGSYCDRVDFSIMGSQRITLRSIESGINYDDSQTGVDIDDPRLNHEGLAVGSSGFGWALTGGTPTLGQVNGRALLAAQASGEGDGNRLPALYVRNEPYREDSPPGEVAELGYVATGARWRSIALYNHPQGTFGVNPVLDYFAVGSSNGVRRGQVSLNSVSQDALASVFFGAPLNARPGDTTTSYVTQSRAEEIADALLDRVGGINNLSEVGSMNEFLSQGQQTDDLHEAIIRNSIGLLTLRQNLFAMIVEVQTLGELPPNDEGVQPVTGVARALAHVWRDPYANPEGIHPMYIRNFLYLDENF